MEKNPLLERDESAELPTTDRAAPDQAPERISETVDTAQFAQAAELDDKFAELRFRQGLCALNSTRGSDARKHFAAARDLDTLRFRCDSKLNDLIRRIASGQERERILLVDSEQRFYEPAATGGPGNELFYEHVHLTFKGNYLLARCIAERIEELAPWGCPAVGASNGPNASALSPSDAPRLGWPSEADCARRLAWTDWNEQAALSDILGRLEDPPFTSQMNHVDQVRWLNARLEQLAPALSASGIQNALRLTQAALESAPGDPFLSQQAASLELEAGNLPAAAATAVSISSRKRRRLRDFTSS